MKKLALSATALCFLASAAFAAAPKIELKPKEGSRAGTTSGARLNVGNSNKVTSPTVRANLGAGMNAANSSNVISSTNLQKLAAGALKINQEFGKACNGDSAVKFLSASNVKNFLNAVAAGVAGDQCVGKFDKNTGMVAIDIVEAGYQKLHALGLKDINSANKNQRSQIASAMVAKLASILNISRTDAANRLGQTVENGCDVVGAGLQEAALAAAGAGA